MNKEYAQYLLKKTIQDYNLIAEDYARTRSFIPDDIKSLGEYITSGDKVLDSGCANGRLFEIAGPKGADFYGIDPSEKLIEIAKKKYPEAKFQVASGLALPFPDNYFDKVYSISVIHHIPSKYLQLRYLRETRRVLKPEGVLTLRAWDFMARGWRIKLLPLKYTFLKLIGISKLDFNDIFWSWKDSAGRPKIQRYFHCFTKNELARLAREAGFKIRKAWRAGHDRETTNIYLVAEK